MLRPYQARAIESLRASLASGKRRPVLQLPTAGGKTIISAEIIKTALAEGRRCVFTAPAISLIDQTVDKFWQAGITDIGVIQQRHPLTNPARRVQVASVQTLARRQLPDASLILVDEAHLCYKIIYQWMQARPDATFIGLSATPWARAMGAPGRWDDLIIGETMAGLTDQGYLVPIRYLRPDRPDLSGVRIIAGDYHEGQLAGAMRRKTILANTVDRWISHGEDRPTIAFCVDKAHAQDVQARFVECGVPWGYIDDQTPVEERQIIGRKIEKGILKGVSSVGCLIVGLDWTFVSCILHARPTRSPMLYIQSIGRGLRLHEGKKDCLVLDAAGNFYQFGHPLQVVRHTLDDGSKKAQEERKKNEKEKREPMTCPSCGAGMRPLQTVCLECGHEVARVRRPSDVVEGDAELVETDLLGDVLKGAKKLAPKDWPQKRKQEFYSGLIALGRERGYKPGWAAVNYKERFGAWPRAHGLFDIAAEWSSPEVRAWVQHKQIRWARRRLREER